MYTSLKYKKFPTKFEFRISKLKRIVSNVLSTIICSSPQPLIKAIWPYQMLYLDKLVTGSFKVYKKAFSFL